MSLPDAHTEDEELVLAGDPGLQHHVLPHGPQPVEHEVVHILQVGPGHLGLHHRGDQVADTLDQTLGAPDILLPRALLTSGRPRELLHQLVSILKQATGLYSSLELTMSYLG